MNKRTPRASFSARNKRRTSPAYGIRPDRQLPVVEGLDPAEVTDLFAKVPHPLRLDDVLRYLDLSRRDKSPLHDLLVALEAQGRLLLLSGGRWTDAGRAATLTGVLSIQRSGAGFVTPDEPNAPAGQRSRDIFIHPLAMGDAWHGDRVEVLMQPPRNEKAFARSGRSRRNGAGRFAAHAEGRILRVLERRQTELAAHALKAPGEGGRVLCRPADPRFAFLLLTDVSALPAPPKAGELLLVIPGERLERSGRGGEPVWEAVAKASMGREEDVAVQERLVKLNHLIPMDFPANVLAEAERLAEIPPEEQPGHGTDDVPVVATRPTADRQDLRALPFVTIDGEDARDFDDAVHVDRLPSGWELWVAIADVSHFVRPGSALDKEARERGNSCYFPVSVEPMLPEALSNGLCSLRPDEDRLVLAVRIRFDPEGAVQNAAFFPGIIRSRARLTYEEVQAAFNAEDEGRAPAQDAGNAGARTRENGKEAPHQRPEALLSRFPGLRDARELVLRLHKRREARGSLDFDLPEARFVVDRESGSVTDIRRRERLFAHRLIEECMLAANEAVARYLTEQDAPFPYRVHPAPDRERLETLFRTLATTGLAPELVETASLLRPSFLGSGGKKASPRSGHQPPLRTEAGDPAENGAALSGRLRQVLAASRDMPQEFLINRLVLRAMMQARYSPEADGHFGLASPCYCHFTSPIRRYADLLVHRALRFTLERGRGRKEASAGPIPAGQKLLALCDQCNARERVAVEAEREINRRLGCLFLRDRVGETFAGIISGVSDFGFFVEFNAYPVEGMVRLETLDDHFEYDAERQELLGAGSGRRFRLGTAVTVRLTDVHPGRLEINLELLASEKARSRAAPSGGTHRPHAGRRHAARRKNPGADASRERSTRRR